ncbi:probable glycosyltransferase At5g25310 [Phalaenopsis equestris]|uniref:probable glycosyltransferase At5g25310 n=1 Tax=Phalaenopsis equestris TaxID=78828 RepID=UPI0009E1E110|nr:probable glycosyltransferase At5g25310 [Phalaenopsis equestris]
MGYCSSSWIQILILIPLLILLPTVLLLSLSPSSPSPLTSTSATLRLSPRRRPPGTAALSASAAAPAKRLANPAPENKLEAELSRARASIRRAAAGAAGGLGRTNFSGLLSRPSVYRNAAAFYQSYSEMERRFRVYVYSEGEAPLVHTGPCKNIYTTEGRFISELELMRPGEYSGAGEANILRTEDPRRAHAFFLPFSVTQLVRYVYRPNTFDQTPIRRFVSDYVDVVASKHPYWNRTAAADHFMLSCHDWGPHASRANALLYGNAIRALCNANTSEGFRPRKDVSIPEINLVTGDMPPEFISPPPPESSPRSLLAFFAGGVHGPVRPVLLRYWKGRDPDLEVHEYLPPGSDDYYSYMRRARFCLCPSGYEVASPRVVEAIYAGCIPVIISTGYVLPFSDVLKWEEFSVKVAVEDIPRLKEVLRRVADEEVMRLMAGVRAVRHHFILNHPPKRFDALYMILHSVWLRRLNIKVAQV